MPRRRHALRDGVAFLAAVAIALGYVTWSRASQDDTERVADETASGTGEPSVYLEVLPDEEEPRLTLGDTADLGGGLRVRLGGPAVSGDDLGPWLQLDLRTENTGTAPQPRPQIGLYCAQSEDGGYALWEVGDADSRGTVPAGAIEETGIRVTLPGDGRRGEAIPACEGTAYLEAATYGEDDWNNPLTYAQWSVPSDLVDDLNDARPDPPPSPAVPEPEPDLDRPYGWTDGDPYSNGYAVAFVRGLSTKEVLRALGPVRRDAGALDGAGAWLLLDRLTDPETYDAPYVVSLAERDGGVVVFSNYGFFTKARLRALSRHGVAASYSNTINGDDLVLVARRGKVVRQSEDLIGSSAWVLLDRLTSISVSEAWLSDQPHPTYVLAGW
ncbi:DUF6461 domain-containing protein [Pimelobacter simplex]|uniref:DUF6461 domain-containing protein n=1 Tax=Nocardioides simplex TaxID=2045 RepID=UPI0037F92618